MTHDSAISSKPHFFEKLSLEWASGGVANAITSSFLNPLDVAKIRMQVESMRAAKHGGPSPTLARTLINLYREGGIVGLWKPGLNASIGRELLYSGPRAGFYVPLRNQLHKLLGGGNVEPRSNGNTAPLSVKILAAMTTGSVGAFIANPIDVLKVRLMASTTPEPILAAAGASAAGNGNRSATIMSNSSSATVYGYGGASSFSSSAAAATVSPRHGSGAQVVPGRRSLRKEFMLVTQRNGFGALYAGLLPSIMRGAMVTVGGLATYDQCKTSIKQYLGVPEGTALHTVSSLITGVVATTVAAPLDVIKTRTMHAASDVCPSSSRIVQLRNEVRAVMRDHGMRGFLRGWVPAYLRLGPHALICYPIFEQIRNICGLDYI